MGTVSTTAAHAGRHPADLIETGNLLRTQPGAFAPPASPKVARDTRRHDVVVIGAGQAGLSVGYHLKRKGIDHVILDGALRIGDVWRNRRDSLRLFTPARFDRLDGDRFPAQKDTFPTNDQMAEYLESYAKRFALPVRLNARVERLHKPGGRFRVETTGGSYEADRVVVAAASYQTPRLADFADDLGADEKPRAAVSVLELVTRFFTTSPTEKQQSTVNKKEFRSTRSVHHRVNRKSSVLL